MTQSSETRLPQRRRGRGSLVLAARHGLRAARCRLTAGISVAIAAGALCAGCGSTHSGSQSGATTTASGAAASGTAAASTTASGAAASGTAASGAPGGKALDDSAQARSGFLKAGPVVHLTVTGDPFAVALIGSRTVPGPNGKTAVAGRKWLEAEVQVENLQTHGSADIGWMDNALHVYATTAVTGQSCTGESVFVGLCTLSVGDFADQGGRPGETFLDQTLPPGGRMRVWVLAVELQDAATGDQMTLTLAPLIYGVKFATKAVITSDAPSGQVPLSAGGPKLIPRPGSAAAG